MRGTSIRSCFLIIALLLVSMTMPVRGQGEQVKIGVLASRGAEETLKTWQPTAEYLTKEIPQYSFVIVPLDVDEIAPAVGRKEVDFVITNPGNYVELEASYGATRIATMESMYGGHYYKVFSSVIFRRADRDDIRDLNDLKGKSFMAVQENIFSWQMAWREFKDKGIDPYREFAELRFSGLPQDLVVYAVRNGKVDAGAVRTGILESMAAEGKLNLSDFVVLNPQHDDFPLLHSTGLYSEWVFVRAKQTPSELAENVTVSLLNMPADSLAAKAASAVWTVPLDYHPVRELMKELRIGPYRNYGKITSIDVIKNYWYWIVIAVAAAGILPYTVGLKTVNKKLRQEISERKSAEGALKESEEKHRTLIENIQDGVFMIQDAKVQFANEAFARICGYRMEEVIGMDFRELVAPEDLEMVANNYQRRQAGENVPTEYEFRIMRKNGEKAIVNMNVGIITYNARVASMGTVKDITERKRALKALRESEARYRRLVEFSPYGIVIHSDHKLVYTNEAAAEIFGARTPQELLGKPMLQFIHPDYHEIVKKRFRMQEKKIIAPLMQEKFLRLDGTSVDVEVVSIPFIYNGKLAMYGVFQDITERKRAEKTLKEREERFRSVVDSAVNAIVLADNTGTIISWNKGAEKIFLYSEKEVLGKPLTILIPERYRDAHLASLKSVSSTGESKAIGKTIELNGLRKDGTEFPIELSLATWKTEKGTFYSGIIHDITERKHADDQIKASLKEKEILLREIHHRVKNNIQVISSLLSLQSEYIKEETYRDMFKESQNRILSMSLIHEKLYQSKDLAKIDFNDYVRDLVYDLFEYYGANTGNIALNVNVENVSLGIDSAIPCGLIINELFTNSLKYAFPDGRKGELKVSLRSIDDNMVELIIGDDGIGIPEDLDFRNTRSLGLHLVTILVENQLHGGINLDRSKGTEFRIKFRGVK